MLTVLWPKISVAGVMGGSIGGSVLGLMAWIVTCKKVYGPLNTTNLASQYSALAGNVVSITMGAVISVATSLVKPADYDFKGTRNSKPFFSVLFNTSDISDTFDSQDHFRRRERGHTANFASRKCSSRR